MEFRLLGPVEVIGDDGVPLALGGRRPRALLALLLLHANEAVSTDRLIDGVWGESAPANALGALQVHVHALRKALGSDRIVTRAPGYLVRVDWDELDLERFTQLVERGDRDALREALALWRGPALADIADQPFARAEAIRLDEGRLAALEARIDGDLDAGRHTGLVAELEALVVDHPHRERLRAQHMLALYRADRQADALASYRDARVCPGRARARALGVAADARAPYPRARPDARSARPQAAPAGANGDDAHRSRARAGLDPGASPPIRRAARHAHGHGRCRENRARPAAASKHGAHVFVDLAPLTDPALVLATIGRAFGVEDDPDLPLLEQVAGVFDTDTRLVVLDNLEHLSEAFADIGRLLAAARGLRILATSRVPLRLVVEHEYRVEPLAAPAQGVTDVGELRAVASVRLYVDRAREAVDAFELTDANGSHVARICRALDGLPLAVELAAARVRVLGPEGTARRLGESIALLSRTTVDVPERQRSLRATIAWSYDLLDDDSRAVFRALAIYPGGTTLDGLEATSESEVDVPASLEKLLDAGLVSSRLTGDGEPRFTMLATIRAFATTLADEQTDTQLHTRQLDYFLGLLRNAHAARKTDPSAYARAVTEDDRDNFRAALTHASAAGLGDELLELAASLNEFWRTTGTLDEGLRWLEESLARFPGGDPRLRGRVLFSLALLTYVRGEPADAMETVDEAIDLLEPHGRPEELGRALWLRGAAAHGSRDFEVARDSYERAIELLRDAGYETVAGRVVGSLAEARRRLGDLEGAVAAARESAEISKRAGDREAHAYALAHVASYDLQRDDREGAAGAVVDALRVASEGGGLWATAIGLLYAAQIAISFDLERESALLLGSAHATFDGVGEGRWEIERDDWEPTLDELRRRLGPDLEPLLEEGRALLADEAVRLALGALPASAGSAAASD